ncbi:MAG TPA: AAA family ATPase [Kribbellaceae bacterium]|nr:AAA family ATPase [Kribbellaceae bacterium]
MADRDLRLTLIGRFEVVGALHAAVPGGRAARLLKILATRQGRFVPVGELVELLWEGRPPDRADRGVASLVSRLRHSLGPGRLDGDSTGYLLVRDAATQVDLQVAEQLVGTAEQESRSGQHAYAAVAAEQAVKLLTAGVPLAGEPEDWWVDDVRRYARQLLRRARLVRWETALELHDHRAAIESASAALAADGLDETAGRALMQAHAAAGEKAAALRVYEAIRSALLAELGAQPSMQTVALFESLLEAPVPVAEADHGPVGYLVSPLVGRDAELRRLRQLWSDASRGHGGIVVVLGEAGIGKTALVSALATEVERAGGLVVGTSCFEAERSLYLQPLVEAVGRIAARFDPTSVREFGGDTLGTLIQLAPQLARTVGPVGYLRAGAEIEHRRSLEALAGFFSRAGEGQPLLLAVDDTQYAGQSTVEALHFLASRLSERRVLVVVAERTAASPPRTSTLTDVATVIRPDRLSRTDVLALVAAAGVRYPADKLFEWTGGSPLFVTELIRHGRRSSADGDQEPDIPDSLQATVSARLAEAGDDARILLQLGAVFGGSFSLDDVAALTGGTVERFGRIATRALREGLLIEQGAAFKFANDIVRKVAYASMPRPLQVSRHRRAAKLFADQPEAAAHQLVAAEDWAPAARAWQEAAQRAHLGFANTDAERLLGHALGCAGKAGDRTVEGKIHLRRAQVRHDLGHLAEAKRDCEAAIAIARELGDEDLEAHALEQLGWTALYARNALDATDLAERATHLAESAAAAPAALPSSLLLVGRVRHWDGDYAGAATAYDHALTSAEDDETTAMVLAYRGALLQHMDRFVEAKSVLERAVVLSRKTGEFRLLLQGLFFTGLARGDLGDLDGALRALDRALRMTHEYDVHYYRAGIHSTSSWLWREIGDLAKAREHAEQAIDLAHRGGGALELEQELHALLALADCELARGAVDDAGALVERALPMLDRSLPFRPRALLRMLEMRTRLDRTVAEELLERSRQHSSRKYEALALHHLGRPEEAARVAAAVGSDLITAELGSPADRRAAVDRIAGTLPTDLRTVFAARGRLATAINAL